MLKRSKVLVVDDEPTIVEVFKEYLTDQGLDVATASSGAEALERLDKDKPDAVFLDMRMPEMDGIETLKRIRAVNLRVPVLMVSANDDLIAAKEAIGLGAFDYTLKPVDFDYLRRALDKMLATAAPVIEHGLLGGEPVASPQVLLYDLALDVFRVARAFSPMARESLGIALEQAALGLVQRAGDKNESVRALNQIRSLLRFAKDLGDMGDEAHRSLESHVTRARRAIGLG
jgi:CheY-like chemotaxis protein